MSIKKTEAKKSLHKKKANTGPFEKKRLPKKKLSAKDEHDSNRLRFASSPAAGLVSNTD